MPTTKVICTICLKENLTSADVTMSPLPFPGLFLVNFELVVLLVDVLLLDVLLVFFLVPCSNSIRKSLNYSLKSCGKNVNS